MSMTSTVYVFNSGELFSQLFNVIAALTASTSYATLLSLGVGFGFAVITWVMVKSQDPKKIIPWFFQYVVLTEALLVPKVSVSVYDVSTQQSYVISNVPMGIGVLAEGLTSIGYALAEVFDMFFVSLGNANDAVLYTRSGFLFGSRLIQETKNFRILDPVLQANFSMYFRRCVVGDVLLTRTLSPTELKESSDIWQAISHAPSPIRRTVIRNADGSQKDYTCQEASPILGKLLDAEVKKVSQFFGVNLLNRPKTDELDRILHTQLGSAFNYYLGLQATGTNLFMQAMMMNMIRDGVVNYQSYMNSSASVVNHAFIKAKEQQRYTWQLLTMKAAWMLPLLHSILTYLLLALFPIIIVLVIAYGNSPMMISVLKFFLSLQLWPVMFAILNLASSLTGKLVSGSYSELSLYSVDALSELHADISGVAGFLSIFIPWLSFGVLGRLGETFNSLSNAMVSSLQSASMSAASEAASASFSLGQTTFFNASGNSLSANKHDSNFTSLSGNTTRLLDSGALLTSTADGNEVIDASASVSRGTVSINSNNAISGMLNRAYENSLQSVSAHSRQFHGAISEGLHHLSQFSEADGKDLRLGEGVSQNESGQFQSAVSRLLGTADSVASKLGITREQAFTGIVAASMHAEAGIKASDSAFGKIAKFAIGVDGGLYARSNAELSDSTSDRYHNNLDKVLDARDAQDFRTDLNTVSSFSKNHHLDASQSHGANLVNQIAGDFRTAQSVARNLDASLAQSERISTAKSVTESGGANISHNLDQMFQEYVTSRVGTEERNFLYGHPGDAGAQARLQSMANDFLHDKGVEQRIIDTYGNSGANPAATYAQNTRNIESQERMLYQKYFSNREHMHDLGQGAGVGVSQPEANTLQNRVNQHLSGIDQAVQLGGQHIGESVSSTSLNTVGGIAQGKKDATLVGTFRKDK